MKNTKKFSWKSTTDTFNTKSLELEQIQERRLLEDGDDLEGDSKNYSNIYRELAELLGSNAARKVWENYAGLTVNFPKRLYSKEYTMEFIESHAKNMSPKNIAREVDLSERRVRQIIQEKKISK